MKKDKSLEDHTFSTSVEGQTLIWNVSTLEAAVEGKEIIEWEIPESFLFSWPWGHENISQHTQGIMRSDYIGRPIIIWDGVIVDGCHRAAKALIDGKTHIQARVIVNIPPPDAFVCDFDDDEDIPDPSWNIGELVEIIKTIRTEIAYGTSGHPIDGF